MEPIVGSQSVSAAGAAKRESRGRHFTPLLAVLVALALVGAACSGSSQDGKAVTEGPSAAKAPAKLVNGGEFTTCTDASFPPMEYFKDGADKPVGFDIDVISKVSESWGVKPDVINTAFDGLLPGLSSGRCDVVWSGIYVTAKRIEQFPAVSYLKTGTVALVQADNPKNIENYEDLAGKTIAVQSGTSLVDVGEQIKKDAAANGLPAPTIQLYPNATDLIQQLILGRADAALTADTEAAYRAIQNPGKFAIGYTFPDKIKMGVYYNGKNTNLGDALFDALTGLKEDGTLAELAANYNLPPDNIVIAREG